MGTKLGVSSARNVLAMLAAAAVLAGCSGSDQIGGRGGGTGGTASGGIGGTAGGVPLAMFVSDFEAAYCAPLVACAVFPDLATCEASMDFAEAPEIVTTVASVGRGHVIYDPAAAAACLTAVSQDCTVNAADQFMTIDAVSPLQAFFATPACTGVFTGTLPLGADCNGGFSRECAPSASCAQFDGVCNGACCDGVCTSGALPAPHALGEDCTDNNQCALPAVCWATCVVPPGHSAPCSSTLFPCAYFDDYCGEAPGANTATCLPRLAPGTPCTVSDSQVDPCVLEAHCAANAAGEDVCIPLAGLGAACDASANPCVGSLVCANGTCVPTLGSGVDCGG